MMRWVIYLVLLPVLLPTQLINGSGWILPLVFRVGFILSTLVKGKFLSVNSLWSKPFPGHAWRQLTFPGHACGVPPEAAPTIEYFKGLVERHSKIMSLRHLDFIFSNKYLRTSPSIQVFWAQELFIQRLRPVRISFWNGKHLLYRCLLFFQWHPHCYLHCLRQGLKFMTRFCSNVS